MSAVYTLHASLSSLTLCLAFASSARALTSVGLLIALLCEARPASAWNFDFVWVGSIICLNSLFGFLDHLLRVEGELCHASIAPVVVVEQSIQVCCCRCLNGHLVIQSCTAISISMYDMWNTQARSATSALFQARRDGIALSLVRG